MTMTGYARQSRGSRGFTLAEVLISVAILVIIMTLLYGSFATSLSAPDEVGSIQERYLSLGRAMNRMARELSAAYLSTHLNTSYEESPKTLFKLAEGRLDFNSFSHLKTVQDANESDQCELSYFLEEDPDNHAEQNLVRREDATPDDDPEHGGFIYVLLRDVVEMKIEAWNGEEWVEEWDSSHVEFQNKLPPRVKYTITIYDENGERRTFVTETKIRLQNPLRFG